MAPTRTAEKDTPAADGETKPQRRKPGRAPVSCAECRRLKLRCDRKVPCETCVKRGCSALCPDGSLPTMKGPRKAAADAEQLKKRVKELEAALKTLQETVSDEPHPLLGGEPTVAPPPVPEPIAEASPPASSSNSNGSASQGGDEFELESDVLDAFGTLTLGSRGEARFFGQTARSEYLLHAPERIEAYETLNLPRLTNITIDEAYKDLDMFCTSDEVGEEAMTCLPSITKALHLCGVFFTYSKFLWYPVSREYIVDDLIPSIYHPTEIAYCHVTKKHGLSLLLMIFALATLFDPDMPPYAAEAHEFYLLARVALRWAPPAYDTTLASIQALIYMSIYLEMSDCEPAHTGSHKAWMQIRYATSMGQSVNLCSARWRLDDAAQAKRARVFWQLATYDAWLSFGYGRPPSISLEYVDSEVPKVEDAIVNDEDPEDASYFVWSWQFTKVLHTIMASAFGAKQPTYAKIIELDRRVRDFPVPPALRLVCGVSETPPAPAHLCMQRLLVTMTKEMTLLNLHRPYFSLAVKEASKDPLRHKFGPSVMAVYRSAWRILTTVHNAYTITPGIVGRYGLVWSYSLACAILLCLLITRASSSPLAGPCLVELEKVSKLFEEAACQCQFASNNINVIRKLRKQAQSAMTSVRAENDDAVACELDRLGGKTQLIKILGERQLYCHSKAVFAPGSRPSGLEVSNLSGAYVQPLVAQDMRTFYQTTDPGVGTNGLANGNGNGPVNGNGLPSATTNAPYNGNFMSGAYPDLSQADVATLMNFDLSAMWDPSVPQGGAVQDAAEYAQPNAADPEATWRALVQQLGI
ncbi:hypothetical protein C8Q78DRAFT_967725 [Trametes maxima]|nr:hypothetical protein C8Q78DRAFT_967725 [Trametes maxima]